MVRNTKDGESLSFKETSFTFDVGRLSLIIRKEIVRLALFTKDNKLLMGYYPYDRLDTLLTGYPVCTPRIGVKGSIISVYKTRLDFKNMELSIFILDERMEYVPTEDSSIIDDKYLVETKLKFSDNKWGIFLGHLERLASNNL